MAQGGDIGFELERFGWTAPGRLEVRGRWSGIHGRRLGRPALTLEAHGRRMRLSALPDASAAPVEAEDWQVAFPFEGTPDDVTAAELEIGRRLVVDLPRPRRSRHLRETSAAVAGDPAPAPEPATSALAAVERLQTALDSREQEVAALRAEVDRLAEADDARARLLVDLGRARDALTQDELDRERLAGEVAQLRADLALRDEELAGVREEVQAALDASEQRLLAEQHAAAGAREEADRLRADLALRDEELAGVREEVQAALDASEQRLLAEQHAAAGAREEADRLRAEVAAGGQEIERLRAALSAVDTHDLPPGAVAAERVDPTVTLEWTESPEPDHAASPAGHDAVEGHPEASPVEAEPGVTSAVQRESAVSPTEDGPEVSSIDRDSAVSPTEDHPVEREREPEASSGERRLEASVDDPDPEDVAPDPERSLVARGRAIAARRGASSPSEPGRAASYAGGNGGTTTEEAPVPVTPAARAAAVRRGEAARTVAQQRVGAGRAVGPHRVPEPHRSRASVWAVRVAAFALVAVLLVALLIIISTLA